MPRQATAACACCRCQFAPRLRIANKARRAWGRRSSSCPRLGGTTYSMFKQLLTPVAGSLPLSFIVAALPVAAVLVLLGVLRRPAWQASLAGLIVGLIIAIGVWSLPVNLAINSVANGV